MKTEQKKQVNLFADEWDYIRYVTKNKIGFIEMR